MPFKTSTIIPLLIALPFASFGQDTNPFQSIGKQGKIISLSRGKYEELFDQSEIQRIGTALVNVRTMKVVRLLQNSRESRYRPDNVINSRFLSVDPVTNKFPMLSPYQYASNSPIAGVDLDGLEFYFSADGSYLGQSKHGGTQIRVATQYSAYPPAGKDGLIITKYRDIDKADPNVAAKVYETIFKTELGDDVKSITVLNEVDRPGLGAETFSKGNFGVNSANVENGEKLNNDYFNAAATLYHEKQHSDKLPIKTNDAFSHFVIEQRVVEKSGLYEKTSANFKTYVKELFESYLDQQEASVRNLIDEAHSDKSEVYSANYYLSQYKKDVKYFNSKYGARRPEYDFQSYEKKLHDKEKSVIQK